jgi:hypothetical protein
MHQFEVLVISGMILTAIEKWKASRYKIGGKWTNNNGLVNSCMLRILQKVVSRAYEIKSGRC